MMRKLAFLFFLLVASVTSAQEPIDLRTVKRLPVPNDAAVLALQDVNLLIKAGRAGELPFTRYVWIPEHRKDASVIDDARAVSGALHYLSRSDQVGIATRPNPLAGGAVLRVNLLRYVRQRNFLEGDIGEWLRTWEELNFDPYFATIITADMVKLGTFTDQDIPTVKQMKSEWTLKDVPRFQQDGQWYTKKWIENKVVTEVPVTQAKDFAALRLAGLHVDSMVLGTLQQALQTQAPIVHVGNFVSRGLSTIEEDGPFRLIYGGRYYEFAGIKKTGKGDNDELNIYKSLGINTSGKSLEEFFDSIGSDRKAAIFFSNVTSRSRQFYWFPSLTDFGGMVIITRDTAAKNIDVLSSAIANLLNFKHAATEGIFVKTNGFHGYFVTDGKGSLLRFADPVNIVQDDEIPRPYRKVLQPAISCIRCHRFEDGMRPFINHVAKLSPTADTSKLDKNTLETYDRLRQLYKSRDGDIVDFLTVTRNRLARAVLQATGPWAKSKDQTDVVRLLGDQITAIEHDYKYELVTPEIACRELGFEPPKGRALELLQTLLPPDSGAQNLVQTLGFVPEDFRLAGLLRGIPIPRTDWHLSYSYAAVRAQRTWLTAKEKK